MFYFIINPESRSGKGKFIWNRVKKELDSRHIVYKAYLTKYEYHAVKLASELCGHVKGMKRIVILGGDGTVNEVLNGILDYSQVLIGYIPSGSSNDLSRSLNIPSDPILALDRILKGQYSTYMDLGVIKTGHKTKVFAVSAGLGFDAAVCYEALDSNLKMFLNKFGLGKLTYAVIALKRILKHTPVDVKIAADQHRIYKFKNVFFVACMNHKYEGGGLKMAPSASYHDGKLDICIIHDIPKIKILILLPSLIFGKHIHFKGATILRAASANIQGNHKLLVHSDGEHVGHLNALNVYCLKNTIQFIN